MRKFQACWPNQLKKKNFIGFLTKVKLIWVLSTYDREYKITSKERKREQVIAVSKGREEVGVKGKRRLKKMTMKEVR